MQKVATLLVLVLLIISMIIAEPTSAAVSKPSRPEFSIKLKDSFYDVPTSYAIDPFTGQNITHPGYRVDDGTVEITIKNQPFTSYIDNGHSISMYYNVRMKGHFDENWSELYSDFTGYLTPSRSYYTVATFNLGDHPSAYPYYLRYPFHGIPLNGKLDFQVEAMIGYTYYLQTIEFYAPYAFSGETSGWSETQTITIANSTVSPTLTPAPTTNGSAFNTSFSLIIILAFVVISIELAVVVSLIVYIRKQKG